MEFWQVYLLINLLAAAFVIWPTLFRTKKYPKELRENVHSDTNSKVYADHFMELEQTMIRGEIDEQEYDGLKKDLEKTLIEENNTAKEDSDRPIVSSFKSRIPVLALVFALPIVSLAIYSSLGAKKDWEIYQLATAYQTAKAPEQAKQESGKLIAALQKRVKQKPEKVQHWYLLATTTVEQGMFEEGVRAYREALALQPNAPTIKAELAQALFLRAGNTVTPEVRKHAQEALIIAPNMPTALGLAGIDAYQSGEYQLAINYWQRALVQLDPNSAASQALTGGIARAQIAVSKTDRAGAENAEAGPSLTVNIDIDKDKVMVDGEDTVFVYARAWQGPRMPLAIQKIKVSDLPVEITLNREMSMAQGMDLGSFPQVELVARISSSGSAVSKPGDWQASVGPVIVASQDKPIELMISEQVVAN